MSPTKEFAITQVLRLESFEGFPKFEFSVAGFMEYVNALMRCQNDQHCRDVVTHFVETATKYPSVAVLLAQIRITAPVQEQNTVGCSKCTAGWLLRHLLVEAPGATPQVISADEAKSLLERIRNTKRTRSMVYEGVIRCGCSPAVKGPAAAHGANKQPSFRNFSPRDAA